MMDIKTIGFVGLGQMGAPMAANITGGGADLIVFDKAGTEARAPEGAKAAGSLGEVLATADTVFLSVPDGPVSIALAHEIAAMTACRASVIIDLSTVGPEASRAAGDILAVAGKTYIDAPVSGGQAGARAGTITIMWGGPKAVMDTHDAVLKSFAKNVFHCGDQPGQGQSVKILNNYLSGVAMAATSEAVLYGQSQGIDMKTILDVVNVSTGRNTASADKFPNRILSETYDAGFKTALEAKDVNLFLDNARAAGTPVALAQVAAALWSGCDEALPGSDFTRIFDYVRDGK